MIGDAQDIPRLNAVPPGALTLDHVAHFVPDMAAASAALDALGFQLTPFSVQSHRLQPDGPLVPAGTANRCIMFERGYLEVLTPTAETPLAEQLRTAIQRYVGIHLIAFGTSSPETDYARLESQGFTPLDPVALQRPISTESGESTARFTVVRVPPPVMSGVFTLGPGFASSSVQPSGFAFATVSAPRAPPAPGRLSITNC